jgi:hypothetical protein
MKSVTRLTMLLATAPLFAACAGSIEVQAPTVGCSTLVPDSWRDPTPSAVLGPLVVGSVVGLTPDQIAARTASAEAERWQVFGTEQTGQLRIETAEKIGGLEITAKCEERDRQAIDRITAPAWQFWR